MQLTLQKKSQVLKDANCPIDTKFIAQFIQSLDPKVRNFRLVAGNIEALLLVHQKQLMHEEAKTFADEQSAVVTNQKPVSLPKRASRK